MDTNNAKEEKWLDEAISDEIKKLSRNKGAAEALNALVKNNYTWVLKEYFEFPKVALKSYEFRIVYEACCNKDVELFASTIRLLNYLDPGMVHGNLAADQPLKFIENPVKISEDKKMARQTLKILAADFMKRYISVNKYL